MSMIMNHQHSNPNKPTTLLCESDEFYLDSNEKPSWWLPNSSGQFKLHASTICAENRVGFLMLFVLVSVERAYYFLNCIRENPFLCHFCRSDNKKNI